MNINKAIEKTTERLEYWKSLEIKMPDEIILAEIQIKALNEMLDREENKPLEIEQLKDMVGEPVWSICNNCYVIIDGVEKKEISTLIWYWNYEECEIIYNDEVNEPKFYKHKPKEVY